MTIFGASPAGTHGEHTCAYATRIRTAGLMFALTATPGYLPPSWEVGGEPRREREPTATMLTNCVRQRRRRHVDLCLRRVHGSARSAGYSRRATLLRLVRRSLGAADRATWLGDRPVGC